MTPVAKRAARDTIWLAMVDRVERLHDKVVLAQARPSIAAARNILTLATELSSLAQTAVLLSKEGRP